MFHTPDRRSIFSAAPPAARALPRPRPAFTLVEILVVVVILGIASAVLIPQLSTRSDLVAGGAARQVMSDLTFAQNLAITTQRPVYVTFVNATGAAPTPGGSYMIQNTQGGAAIDHPVQKTPWRVQAGAGGSMGPIRLSGVDFNGLRTLMFDETGSPFALPSTGGTPAPLTTGTIVVGCNDFTLTVRVEALTGTLSVQ